MCSHFSGKKKVYQDGRQLFEVQKFGTSFQYPFQIGNHMLNIVQHGEIFELRIDNQSFSHLYHQDRTKRAFVYDGEEASEPRQEPYGGSPSRTGYGQEQTQQQDTGYIGSGAFKRGNSDVDSKWNKGSQSNNPYPGKEDPMWADVRQVREGIRTGNDIDYSDLRQKKYDEFSPDKKKTKLNESQHQPKQFDFGSFGLDPIPANAKKAQYINKPQTTDNLLDLGSEKPVQQVKTSDDLFNFQPSTQIKPQQQTITQAGFDFDFGCSQSQTQSASNSFDFFGNQPSSQIQQQPSSFDFNFSAQNKTSTFDFDSYGVQPTVQKKSSPQKDMFDLIDTSSSQIKSTSLDEMLGSMSINANQISGSQIETEEQRKIKELLATGYNQTNIQANLINKHQGKENQEASLVNLDDLMGNKPQVIKNAPFQPAIISNHDPFAEAFNSGIPLIAQTQQKDAFNFVQQELKQNTVIPNIGQDQQHSQPIQNSIQQIEQSSFNFDFNIVQQQQQAVKNDFNFF